MGTVEAAWSDAGQFWLDSFAYVRLFHTLEQLQDDLVLSEVWETYSTT